MRLWSIHPCNLDAKGLVALWRESLLAQSVLQGKTLGYKNHPQLKRFRKTADPAGAIASYLHHIVDEADSRGYNFDRSKIVKKSYNRLIPVTDGQVKYEFRHLLVKLKKRDAELYHRLKMTGSIKIHPMMQKTAGGVEDWEKT